MSKLLRGIVKLHSIDRFAFLIICPLVTIFQIILIITFIKYEVFKHSPEDVIFSLIIVEGFLNLIFFFNACSFQLI